MKIFERSRINASIALENFHKMKAENHLLNLITQRVKSIFTGAILMEKDATINEVICKGQYHGIVSLFIRIMLSCQDTGTMTAF